jgi:hypothetical protein
MKFYLVTKKNKILSFTSEGIELENIILSKVSQAQKAKNSMFSFICGLYTKSKCNNIIGHGSHTNGGMCMEE